ncbi:MAG: hypothetical protein WC755_03300 [Candidatus Woesearchaeota archaeon]
MAHNTPKDVFKERSSHNHIYTNNKNSVYANINTHNHKYSHRDDANSSYSLNASQKLTQNAFVKKEDKRDLGFFFFLLFLLLVLLCLPSILRYDENEKFILGSSESYYHLRISEYVFLNGVYPDYDWLSFEGRSFHFVSFYEFLLSFISKVFGIPLFYLVLFMPVFFGVISFLLLYYVFIKLEIDKLFRRIFFLLLITSPLFLYLFSVSNYFYVPFFLLSLCAAFFVSRTKYFGVFSVFFVLIMPFFGYVAVILCILLLLLFYMMVKGWKVLTLCGYLLLSLIFFKTDIFFKFTFRSYMDFSHFHFLITDFGFISGFSIFCLILCIIGYISQFKKEHYYFYEHLFFILFTIVTLLLFYFIDEQVLFFANFVVIYYATYGLIYILKFRYESKFIRPIMIIILLSGLLFTPISYTQQISKFYPDKETVLALEYLGNLSDQSSTVFSREENGVLINSIAKLPNVIDELSVFEISYYQRSEEIQDIYYTRNISFVDDFFEKYNIGYVIIDKNMRDDVWIHDNQGFLFLLKTSERFEKIYNTTNIVIYKYSFVNNQYAGVK